MTSLRNSAPRLLAGFGTAALIAAVGLFASSRPAHTAGGPTPVTVSNSSLAVTTVRASDIHSPFNQTKSAFVDSFGRVNSDALSFSVPAGKRMVIETISSFVSMPSGHRLIRETLETISGAGATADTTAETPIVLSYQGTASDTGNDWYAGTQQVRLYADPGTTVGFFAFDNRSEAGGLVNVSISGYYVDVP